LEEIERHRNIKTELTIKILSKATSIKEKVKVNEAYVTS
jgi:hypothetical protein